MFLACADMNYQMAGMPMDPGMVVGMVLIIAGTVVAAFGLLPPPGQLATVNLDMVVETDESVKLNREHVMLMIVLTIALIIDTMKPATLGFVTPGVAKEYGLTKAAAAMLPFVALTGTVTGSLVWGFWPTSSAGERRSCWPRSCSPVRRSAGPCPRSAGTFSCVS